MGKNTGYRRPYPYSIPEIDRRTIRNPRPLERNEFFFIEALLRSSILIDAYGRGGKKGERALLEALRARGIHNQSPLKGTHHALLGDLPPVDPARTQAARQLGHLYHQRELYFLDLGVIARNPPSRRVAVGPLEDWYAVPDGLQYCQALLTNPDPMHLCLRIDLRKPTHKILAALRPLLAEMRQQAESHPRYRKPDKKAQQGFWERKAQTPIEDLGTWLDYLRCYDLYRSGLGPTEIGRAVYRRDIHATVKASQARRRVEWLIAHAEQGLATWPPHDVP